LDRYGQLLIVRPRLGDLASSLEQLLFEQFDSPVRLLDVAKNVITWANSRQFAHRGPRHRVAGIALNAP